MLRMSTPALLARMILIVVVLDAARAAPAMQANTEAAFRLYLPQMRVDLVGAVRSDLPGTIAFVRDGDIYAYHPRTGAIRLVIPNGREVEFSRDGTQLAFVRDDGVYVAAADGSNIRRVVAHTAVSALHWTDDGSKLLWERPLDLDPARWWAGNEIWTLLLANGTTTKIALGFDAAWAPDGWCVAYTTPLPDRYEFRNELHLVTWRGDKDWAVVTRLPANTPPIGTPGSEVLPDQLPSQWLQAPVWNAQGSAIYVSAFVMYQFLSDFFIWERADATTGGSVFVDKLPDVSDAIASPDRRGGIFHWRTPRPDQTITARTVDPTLPAGSYAWADKPLLQDQRTSYGALAWSPHSNAVAVFGCPQEQECGLVLLTPDQDQPSLLIRGIRGSEVSWGR